MDETEWRRWVDIRQIQGWWLSTKPEKDARDCRETAYQAKRKVKERSWIINNTKNGKR